MLMQSKIEPIYVHPERSECPFKRDGWQLYVHEDSKLSFDITPREMKYNVVWYCDVGDVIVQLQYKFNLCTYHCKSQGRKKTHFICP